MANISLTNTASQMAELQRRQKLAEMLTAQSGEPIEVQAYKGIQAPISPYAGLAKVLQAYMGAKQASDVEKKRGELEKLSGKEFTNFMQNYEGTPEVRSDVKTVAASQPAPLAAPTAAPEMINTAAPAIAAGTPPQKMAQALQSTMDKGSLFAAPRAYGNAAPEAAPEAALITAAHTNTPQEKIALAIQAMGSGNSLLAGMAPSMYEEARKEEKSGKIFEAIGKANKVGADEDVMAAYKAANDPGGAVDYLSQLGLKKEDAAAAAAAYKIKEADTAEQRELDRQARIDIAKENHATQMAIAQMNADTRRDIAAAVSAKGPKITEGQRRSASLAYRALEGNNRLNDLGKEGIYGPSTPYDSLFKRDKNGLTTMVLKSDQDRRYMQAFKEFIAPILRYDSGAAVPDSEVESYMQTYGNKFEDSTKVRWQKAQGRAAAIKSLVGPARVAYEDAYGETPSFKVMAINPNAQPAPKKPTPSSPSAGGKRPLTDDELVALHGG